MKRFAIFLAACSLRCAVIVADPSDFTAYSTTGNGDTYLWDTTTGDYFGQAPTLGARSLFRFSLAGLGGQTLQGALLTVTLVQTRKDQYPAPGIVSNAPPFINPGIGAILVT